MDNDEDDEDDDVCKNIIVQIEGDTYYCFSKVLNGILDNYTDKTPGINKSI